jgi:phage terminase large subunit
MLTKFKRRHKKKRPGQNSNHIPIEYPPFSFGGNAKWEAFSDSDSTLIALFGGNRSGKTHTNIHRQLTKIRNNPGCVTWFATETADMIGQTIWPKFKELTNPREYHEPAWANKRKGIPAMVQWVNGSQTWFKTYAQGRESFQAAAVDDIGLSEEPKDHHIITECIARVGSKGGQVAIDMTPLMGKTWPYHNIDQKHKPGIVESWRVSLFENPFISQKYKDTLVELYGVDEVDRRVYGLFTMLEGAVFKEWDETRHVQDFGTLPADIDKATSIDLGSDHPFCALFGGYFDEKLYVWAEYYSKNNNMYSREHAQNILAYENDLSYFHDHLNLTPVSARPCDWDRQVRLDLEDGGLHWTTLAIKDTEASWDLLNRLMKHDKIVIHPRCIELIRTIPMYRYKPNRAGADEKEAVMKVDDDPVDALRYLAMYFFNGTSYDLTGGWAGGGDDLDL